MDLDELLLGMVRTILNGASVDAAGVSQSAADWSKAAADTVEAIHSTVVVPISMTVLGAMCMMELVRLIANPDAGERLKFQAVVGVGVKLVVLVEFARNVNLLIGGIDELVQELLSGIADYATSGAEAGPVPADVEAVISNAGTIQQIGALALLLIPWLIALAGGLIVDVLVFLRFLEIFLLTAFASLPIVFFANAETKSITFGYLKKYAGVLLQGAVIMMVVTLFSLVSGKVAGVGEVGDQSFIGWVLGNIGPLVFIPIAFIVAVMMSGRVSKALMGE